MYKKLVIISGMHRSGTSATAKMLIDLGFYAGNNLMPASKDNPMGFWEDMDIFNLNNTILDSLFLTWDKLENFNKRRINIFDKIIWDNFHAQAIDLINKKIEQSELTVIKDPRFSILLPFWNMVFNQVKAKVYFIHTFRNPLSVAKSLEKRDGISIKNGLLLWYYYNISSLLDLNKPILIIQYQELIDHPVEILKKIHLFTEINNESKKLNLEKICKQSIKKDLNHHQVSNNELYNESEFFGEIIKLWKQLLNYSSEPIKLIEQSELSKYSKKDIVEYLVSENPDVFFSNLHCYNTSTNGQTHIVKLKAKTGKTNLNFEIGNTKKFDKFYIHFYGKPCHIILDKIKIVKSDNKEELISFTGNYIYNKEKHYYFSTNSPFLQFKITEAESIKSIKLSLFIESLVNKQVEVLIPILHYQQLKLQQNNKNQIAQNESIINKLNTANEENLELIDKLKENKNKGIHLQNQVDKYSLQLEQYKSTIEIKELKIDNYNNKILKLKKQEQQYQNQLKYAESEKILFLKNIDNYKKKNSEYFQKIIDLQSLIDQQNLEIQNQKLEFAQLEKKNSEYFQKTIDLQSLIDQQNLEIQNQKREIVKLEKKSLWLFSERNKVFESHSWKVTKPLRWITSHFRKLSHFVFILKNDIKVGYQILKRDGLKGFIYRLKWYLKGKRLKEDIDLIKNGAAFKDTVNKTTRFNIIKFKKEEIPLVSIIIPVHNQWAYTYNCLKSIKENTQNVSYEVIIADDVSTDDTSNISSLIKNITHIRNEKNLGFLQNCNKAANYAKGRYIHFLNNDTEVLPLWLESLVNLMEKDPKIALVGSKLVYPNGELQEAGGIIWADASGWNYGRGDNPEKSEYNYIKEVDYVSGASMLIKKSVWEKLGGFDEQYSPAYFEDTDLAYRVRELGLKVMYQPESIVIHYEGISNGTDLTSGIKKFQYENQKKFLKRWKSILQNESSPNAENVFVHRDRSLKKRHILVIDHYVPHFDQDAGSRSTFSYLKLFIKMGYSVKFIGDNFYRHQPYTQILQQMGVEVIYGDYYQKNIFEWIKINGKYFDYIITHRMHIAPKYLDVLRKNSMAKIAYVGHDLQFASSMRKFDFSKDENHRNDSIKFKEIETKIFQTVDIVFPFSTYEAPLIQNIVPEKIVKPIPVYFFDDIPEIIHPFKDRKDILFVGFFGHPPNIDAILWFTNKVFPHILKNNPEIKLHIVGSKPTTEILNLKDESINVTGYVSDKELSNYYKQCRVAVLPLRFGAGVKGKLLESLYNQIPAVITSVAAEGVPEIEDYTLIANEPLEFAKKTELLYNNEKIWNRYSLKGKELIMKYFTEDSARKIIEDVFEESIN